MYAITPPYCAPLSWVSNGTLASRRLLLCVAGMFCAFCNISFWSEIIHNLVARIMNCGKSLMFSAAGDGGRKSRSKHTRFSCTVALHAGGVCLCAVTIMGKFSGRNRETEIGCRVLQRNREGGGYTDAPKSAKHIYVGEACHGREIGGRKGV